MKLNYLRATYWWLYAVCISHQCCGLGTSPLPAAKLILSKLTAEYVKSLQTRPFVTNIATASSLSVLSDSISQHFERSKAADGSSTGVVDSGKQSGSATVSRKPGHSFYRSLCMSIYGAVVYGWLIIYWFKFLNWLVPVEGMTMLKALKKVFINQLVMSPLLNSLFFTYVIFTRDLVSPIKDKIATWKLKMQRDLVPTMARSCVYWGIAQFINFYYISVLYGKEFQLLYTNTAFVLWTTYVSYIGYRRN
jgi:Mpv17 / PMP22 family